MAALGATLLVVGVPGVRAQMLGGFEAPPKSKEYVRYDAEPEVVRAGRRDVLELRFVVRDGFHVNSHQPRGELLMPTRLELDAGGDVTVGEPGYPKGSVYRFRADPGEALDVYTGAFTVTVPVEAGAGAHALSGTLRYQACDAAVCYPPKSVAVRVLFTAR